MFYSEGILAKKGALAKVWLAAHWERKLTKSQFLQTNLACSIDAILVEDPEREPMALRLSGQLLLGCARIYSRQTKYLLEDCGEALGKIRASFKPGAVDLPDEQAIATFHAITMGDGISEFDILLPEPVLDLESLHHVSKAADITIADTQGSSFYQLSDAQLPGEHVLDNVLGDLRDAPEQEAADQLGNEGPMDMDGFHQEDSIELELGRDALAELPFTPTRRQSLASVGGSSQRLPGSQGRGRTSLLEDFSFANERNGLDVSPHPPALEWGDILGEGDEGATATTGPGQLDKKRAFLDHLSALGGPVPGPAAMATGAAATVAKNKEDAAARAQALAAKRTLTKRRKLMDETIEIPSRVMQAHVKDTAPICVAHMRTLPATRRLRDLDSLIKRRGSDSSAASWYISTAGHDDASPRFRALLQYRWERAPKLLGLTAPPTPAPSTGPLLALAAEPDALPSPVPRRQSLLSMLAEDVGARESSFAMAVHPGNASLESAAFDGILEGHSFEAGPDFEPVEDVSFGELAMPPGLDEPEAHGPDVSMTAGTPAKAMGRGARPTVHATQANQEQDGEQVVGGEGDEDDLVAGGSGLQKTTLQAIHSLQGHFAADPKLAFSAWTRAVRGLDWCSRIKCAVASPCS